MSFTIRMRSRSPGDACVLLNRDFSYGEPKRIVCVECCDPKWKHGHEVDDELCQGHEGQSVD